MSKSTCFLMILLSLFFIAGSLYTQATPSITRIVFCDVGQGSAVYIRTATGVDMLFDAGPSKLVMNCLGTYMPFYDKTIEYAFLSHGQHDHFGGFEYVLRHYNIDTFVTTSVIGEREDMSMMSNLVIKKKVHVEEMYSDETIFLSDTVSVRFWWPSRTLISGRTFNNPDTHDPLGKKKTYGDLNDFSQVLLFSEGEFDLIITGDVTPEALMLLQSSVLLPDINYEVLQVPHHGSKNGLTESFLTLVKPEISIIQAGKQNKYGHPAQSILDMLKKHNVTVLSTTIEGNIVIEIEEGDWRIVE